MGFTVGGDTAWRVKQRGNLITAYHWIKGEPAMVIYPVQRFRGQRLVPYALPLEAAHEVVMPGNRGERVDTQELLKKASVAAELFGRADDYEVIKQIADTILNGIDDLLDMPPEPKRLERHSTPTGEATLSIGGTKIAELEV